MTTLTSRVAQRSAAAGSRPVKVLRLHLTNTFTTIGMPLLILAFIFGVNYVIWLLIYNSTPEGNRQAVEGTQYSGATFYIFLYMAIIAIQVVLRTFPFALGFTVTRRDFALGTAMLFGVLAVTYTVILTITSYLEEATGGWGLGGHMFSTVYFGTGSLAERLSSQFFAFSFFFFVGAAIATVYLRWRAMGQIVLWITVTLLSLGAVTLITVTNGWPAVGTWFTDAGAYGVAAWSLVITAVAAVFAYLVLRRATPAN